MFGIILLSISSHCTICQQSELHASHYYLQRISRRILSNFFFLCVADDKRFKVWLKLLHSSCLAKDIRIGTQKSYREFFQPEGFPQHNDITQLMLSRDSLLFCQKMNWVFFSKLFTAGACNMTSFLCFALTCTGLSNAPLLELHVNY